MMTLWGQIILLNREIRNKIQCSDNVIQATYITKLSIYHTTTVAPQVAKITEILYCYYKTVTLHL